MNNFRKTKKLKLDYLCKGINFLDVLLTKNEDNDQLQTILYRKTIDKHISLNAAFCHGTVNKKSIPNSQVVRLKRICSNEDDLKVKLIKLENCLINRVFSQEALAHKLTQQMALKEEFYYLMSKTNWRSNYIGVNFSSRSNQVLEIVKKVQ